MNRIKTILLQVSAAMFFSGAIAGCGLKGDLYLPEDDTAPEITPEIAPEIAPAADAAAEAASRP